MNFDENTFARLIERAEADDTLRPEHQRQLRRRVLDVFDLGQLEPTRSAFLPTSFTDWRWIMRSRVSRFAAATIFAIALGTVSLWFHGSGADLALADFVQPLVDVHSARFKMASEMDGKPPVIGHLMVLNPDRMRQELPGQRVTVMIWDYRLGRNLGLIPEKKRAILLKFEKNQSAQQQNYFVWLRTMLLEMRDKPDSERESLGEKEVGGRRAVGYRFKRLGQVIELWGDPKAGLPLLVEQTMPGHAMKITYSDFEFNVKLDESLFDTEAVPGYKIVQMDCMPGTEKDLIDMFRAYSEAFNGIFPDALDPWPYTTYVEKYDNFNGRTPTEEESWELSVTNTIFVRAWGFVNKTLPTTANARYAGKGVSFGSAKMPIFWYRPEDATTYRVIFADLSVRNAKMPPKVANAQRVPAKPTTKAGPTEKSRNRR